MQTDHGPDALDAATADAGLSVDAVRKMVLPAVRLSATEIAHDLGGSRLGGLPDLPVDLAWPRWDTTEYDNKQLAEAEAQAGSGDYPRRRFEELRNRGSRLTSDDDLDWMWGDDGNLFFWMHEDDIAGGAWDRAWFQLQCG